MMCGYLNSSSYKNSCSLLLRMAVVAAFLIPASTGNFLDEPSVRWTYRLPGSGSLSGRGLRKHNEVLASPDGSTVFATADDGSLHFIFPNNLDDSFVFEPQSVRGTFTESRSGVTLVQQQTSNNDGEEELDYVVYAVADVPVETGVTYDNLQVDESRSSTLSRLLAVNLDGTLRWSVPFSGSIIGKPIIGDSGNKLYVVHNVPNLNGPSLTQGKVSVVLLRGERPVLTASISALGRSSPFGPPAGATVRVDGEDRDVLVVAEAWENGYAAQGQAYMFMPSSLHDEFEGQGNDAYELRVISSDWEYSSVTRPAVNEDGTEVFFGAMGARFAAWTGLEDIIEGRRQGLEPDWELALEPNLANASQPFTVAPILSEDETTLYQVGATTEVYCIDAQNGNVLWRNDGPQRSAILAEPRLIEFVEESPKVYVIEGMNGRVRQHDALSGDVDWQFDCRDVSGSPCNDAVEAEFSSSPSGNVLYYGDIFGKIVALEIAAFETTAPTEEDTDEPTDVEDEDEVLEEKPTDSPTFAPKEVHIDAGDITMRPPDNIIEVNRTDAPSDAVVDNLDNQSAAAASEDDGISSFFSNEIMIILVAVCGGLAMTIVLVLIVQKYRYSRGVSKVSKSRDMMEDYGRDWGSAEDQHEEDHGRDDEEALRAAPVTPQKDALNKKSSKNKMKLTPITPSTLASIEESPAECELSFVSDASPKNLEKSFEETFKESLFNVAKEDPPKPEYSAALPAPTSPSRDTAKKDDSSSHSSPVGPPDLSCVEVVKSPTFPKEAPQSPLRTAAAATCPDSPDYAANDIMSVDGSLYLDDDSLIQGNVEVASLAQYSYASTKDEVETTLGEYEGEEDAIKFEPANDDADIPGSHYLRPPSRASPVLSPHVADYFRRNKSPLAPRSAPPATESALSTKATTPSNAGKSPQNDGSGRMSARAGQSVRRGGSGLSRDRSRDNNEQSLGLSRDRSRDLTEQSRGRSPPAHRAPETEEAEPEDAWNSFLNELAKAEREFFNPSYSKKQNMERATSPPPPPPVDSPPGSPGTLPPPPPPDP